MQALSSRYGNYNIACGESEGEFYVHRDKHRGDTAPQRTIHIANWQRQPYRGYDVVTLSNATSALHKHCNTSQQLGIRGKRRLSTKKIRLVSPPVSGVAPGIAYDRTIDLIFDDSDVETVKLAAVMEVQGEK